MKKGGKNADVAPPPPPPPVDSTPQDLLNLFAQERGKKRLDLVEFTHAKYNDWLRYFGFAMDTELEWSRQHKPLDGERSRAPRRATISMHRVQSPPHKSAASLPSLTAPSSGGGKKEGINEQCPFLSNIATASACWTLPPNLDAVDAVALGLGPLPQATTVKAVVEACTKPYQQVTWRLSAYACTHYKVRAIYRWLCHNVRVTPPQPKAASGPSVTIQDPGAAAVPKKAAVTSGKKGALEAAAPVATPTNPEDAAIVAKTADPLGVAQLFARMCEEAGVEVEVVKGTLKGVLDGLGKPHAFVPWAWNIVKANDEAGTPRQYLVDVALSSMYMTPFESHASKRAQTPSGGPTSPPPAAPTGNAAALTTPAPGARAANTFVDMASGTKVFEPFYFYTKPQSFGPLHFPEDHSKLLLQNLVTKTQWEVSPRLTHEFFALGLTLDSHKRRCTFTTKSTPVYVSVLVDRLATTDLICRVYKGQMAGLDPTTSESIEPRFVWQQREEAEKRVTFSIMMPDVGHYTIAIGGRTNPSQCGATLPSGAYFPTVLVYQALVNFVSVNEPMFPLQHISPTVAKLVEPLRHKILGGQQRFAVAPCVPNVFAVGIVNRVFKPPSAAPPRAVELPAAPGTPTPRAGAAKKATGAKASAASTAPAADVTAPRVVAAPEIERVHMELLQLNPKSALFEGLVDLHVGLVEIWIFFGDPTSLSVASGGNEKPPAAVAVTIAEGGGDAAAAPAAIGSPIALNAPNPPFPAAVKATSSLKAVGKFYPLTTEIQVVKRVPAKELALNEGRSLIQPLPQIEADRGAILQMLTDAGDPVAHPRPTDSSGQPRVIGAYFDKKRQLVA